MTTKFFEAWEELNRRICKDFDDGNFECLDKGRFCFVDDTFEDNICGRGIKIIFTKDLDSLNPFSLTLLEDGTFHFNGIDEK